MFNNHLLVFFRIITTQALFAEFFLQGLVLTFSNIGILLDTLPAN